MSSETDDDAEVRTVVGDLPSPWQPETWVVQPELPSVTQQMVLDALIDQFKAQSVPVQIVTAVRVAGPDGIKGLVRASDFRRLYQRAHRARLAVMTVGQARVQLDVRDRPSRRGSVELEDAVRHKVIFRRVTSVAGVVNAVAAAGDWWAGPADVKDWKDPRCLPRLAFGEALDVELGTPHDRKKFRRTHRYPWVDSKKRVWKDDGPYHGQDVLHLLGTALPRGFHWDAQCDRETLMHNGWETWHVRPSYANVYPDGTITNRTGRGFSGEQQELTAGATAKGRGTRNAKTPKSRRRPSSTR